jgi:SAM-dependent methyltransferase
VTSDRSTATAWDTEYHSGRYLAEPPVAFTGDILTAAQQADLTRGLYIGCGNGRNYLPLVTAGLDLTGLDISATAIDQLTTRAPSRHNRLICGDLTALPDGATWPLVIGIQVFQHGNRDSACAHIRAAQQRVTPGGLFCLRVNAAGTDIWPEHDVTECEPDGGLTVRYRAGAKQGLLIHFFGAAELDKLFATGFTPILPIRLHRTWRTAPEPGQWSQWEAIWRRAD